MLIDARTGVVTQTRRLAHISVLEHVTVADVANTGLPDAINRLADDPEAWVTR